MMIRGIRAFQLTNQPKVVGAMLDAALMIMKQVPKSIEETVLYNNHAGILVQMLTFSTDTKRTHWFL